MTYIIHTIDEDLETVGFGFEEGYPRVKTFHNDEYMIIESYKDESIKKIDLNTKTRELDPDWMNKIEWRD